MSGPELRVRPQIAITVDCFTCKKVKDRSTVKEIKYICNYCSFLKELPIGENKIKKNVFISH